MTEPSGWEILASLSTFGQFLIACWVGWYGYRKYLSDEHIEPSEDRIEIFSTAKQTTELRISENGLECIIHDIREGRGGLQWTLAKADATPIEITAVASSSKAGRIRIGPRKGWLYSYKLWPEKEKLIERLENLVRQMD
ncbi:hypothetical protein FLL45_19810 [Aliikangiella marina]|uniref:Uncharacterized protein n=1 Tax=Aliikangiella marina TaxID=1712262 RepID=A0A545T2G1_9GAMM|nr:hypothetical protein [Aliikangiella marina]TQV71404.1 hypothetical protein FLL45_19810 [Aliikangiella marina]